MKPERLTKLMKSKGKVEKYPAEQVFHAQAFPGTLFMLKKGFVKRYQVTKADERVIELIYGPGHIFPLTQLYKKLFGVEQNQEDLVYVYQAMTDIEIQRISDEEVVAELEKDPELYKDLFYEAGLRLKSNIDRLASNTIKDDYKKVAHQLVCLADEFGNEITTDDHVKTKIKVPLASKDVAEQLNISEEVADAVVNSLVKNGLLEVKGKQITLLNVDMLKDVYL